MTLQFTFQYGEIKSKVICSDKDIRRDLHSSMERLKAADVVLTQVNHKIYIPVWRD